MKKTDETYSASLPAFLRKTAREIPGKLPATLFALFVYYWLPLLLMGRKDMLLSSVLLAPVLACAAVFLTQPKPTSRQATSSQDHNSMNLLIIVTITSQIAVMIDWARNGAPDFKWNVFAIVGLILMVTGLLVRVWAIMELGKYFDNSVRILADHEIIETGPYRHVRHGSYTGVYLLAIGIAIYFSAWWGLGVSLLALGAGYYYRIQHEERAMREAFGRRYHDYCRRTYRMFPYIW